MTLAERVIRFDAEGKPVLRLAMSAEEILERERLNFLNTAPRRAAYAQAERAKLDGGNR